MLHNFENQFHRPYGQIVRIPAKFVECGAPANPVVVSTIAKQYRETEVNVLPVFVVETEAERYQAIHNSQILEAAKQAGLDFVMCVIVHDGTTQDQFEIELGQRYPEIDIKTATLEDIKSGIAFLKATQTNFAKIDVEAVAAAIEQQRQTKPIKTFSFLAQSKVGIGKAKVGEIGELFTVR